ncbi:hypothetical protein M9Y10_017794 [Tritrichomonas musculus]|uniref:BEACH domain-containing protein n=1 Tax=Tritrichomonas musculus TaxID=1915356 RepID=A0ABR2HW48_9EUKA
MKTKKLEFPEIQTIFSVFELKASISKAEANELLPDEREFYLSLPRIDKNKFEKLKKDFANTTAEKLFTKALGSFTFSSANIKKICSLYNTSRPITKASVVYIFFNIMTYLYFQRQVVTSEQFTILINGLYKTINVPGCIGFSSFFFQSMMNLAITFPTMYWDEQLIYSVCEFIETDTNLSESFYFTFVQICQIIFSLNNKSSTKCILITINKIYKSKNRCIMATDQTDMMQCLTPFALQPHPLIFEIIPAISMVSQCQAVLDMYVNFVSNLYKSFFEEPITIDLGQSSGSKFILPEVKNPSINNYCFSSKNHQTFPKGFSSLPSEFYETIEIRLKFPSSIWNYLSILSTLLRKSNSFVVDFFFQSLSNFIISSNAADDTIYFTVVASIIYLMKENATPTRLQIFTSILISDKIFNSEDTIFQEGGIDPTLNYFRHQVISLLAEKDIDLILTKLFDKKHPLLFTEIMGRLLAMNCDMKKLTDNHQFFSDLYELMFTFQTIDECSPAYSKTMNQIRSIYFLFLEQISIYSIFRDSQFFPIFCRFLFEIEIADQVLFILRKNLCFCKTIENIEIIEERISMILKKCSENNRNDDRYSHLAIQIAKAFVIVMRINKEVIDSVERIFDYFMICFKSKPSEEFNVALLKMIRLITSSSDNFSLSNDNVIVLSNFTKNNKQFEKECFIHHTSILSNSRIQRIKENNSYFIHRPKFLLFFLASFGSSSLFECFLSALCYDCQFSFNTAKKCHKGYLDIILLKFLEKRSETATIQYNELNIELNISMSAQKKFVIPILISILSSCSSYSTMALLHRMCKENHPLALSIYDEAITNCSMRINPLYLISPLNLETKLSTSVMNSKSFSMCFEHFFSFSFWFKLDFEILIRLQPIVTFFKISNKKATLSVNYINSSLVLECEVNGSIATSSVPLSIVDNKMPVDQRLKSAKMWHFLGLSFMPDDGFQTALVYYDGSLKTSTPMKLPLFTFSKLSLNVEVGLCNLTDCYSSGEIGYVSKVCLFDKCLTTEEFNKIYTEDCSLVNNVLLFDVLTPLLKSQNLIDLYSEEFAMKSFIDTFHSNLNINFLLNLKNIFTFIPFSQRWFITSSLIDRLFVLENRDFNTYLAIYSIFESISYEPLQIEWFDKILVNMDLWMTCDKQSLLSIVSHWYSILFVNYQNLFGLKSHFSEFFVQFVLYFKELKELLEHSLKFLINLAYLNFSSFDTRVFFDITFGSSKSENLPFYLTILENISNVIDKEDIKECLIFLHALIDSAEKNTLQILSVIHNINIVDRNLETIVLTKQISSSKEHLLNLLKEICTLENTPNYPSLFFCLILSIPDKESIDESLNQLLLSSIPRFWDKIEYDDENWFLWPLILAFNIDQSYQNLIFELLANSTFQFSSTTAKITAMQNICYMATFLSSISSSNNKTQLYLSCLVNTFLQKHVAIGNIDSSFITELINQILYSIFYHLNFESHNKILLQEFENSPFYSKNSPFIPFKYSVFQRKINSVDDILELANISSPSSFGLQLLFTKNGQIEGHSLIQATVPLIQFLKDKHDYVEIIKHFAMNNKLIKKEIKLFDKMKKEFSEQFIKTIETILKKIKTLTNYQKEIISKVSQFNFSKYEELMNKLLIPPKPKEKAKENLNEKENEVEYIRSCSPGTCEFPSKMKLKRIELKNGRMHSNSFLNENEFFYYDRNYSINFNGDRYDRNNYSIQFLNAKNRSDFIQINHGKNGSIASSSSSSSLPGTQSRTEVSIPQAFLLTVRKKKHVSLQITKDEIKMIFNSIGDKNFIKIVYFSDVEKCYFSGDSKFEIHLFNGRSYLFDISPHFNTIITKYLGVYNAAAASISSSSSGNIGLKESSAISSSPSDFSEGNKNVGQLNSPSSAPSSASCGKIIQHINQKCDWTSNFEYLLLLNEVSGRSFNNPDLYPIFPQVSGSFDDFKPVQNLASEPSLILNSMTIKTIELNWESGPCSPIKITDLLSNRVVFPEVYYFPELFQANANMSENDKSDTANNFLLPKWSNSSQFEFVYKMRKLLESPTVTESLPKWIDVVWGDRGHSTNIERKHSILFTSPHSPKELFVNRHLTHQLTLQTQTAQSPSKPSPSTVTSPHQSTSSSIILALCDDNVIGVVMEDRKVVFNRIVVSEQGINLIKARSYRLENSLDDKILISCGSSILTFNKQACLLTIFRSYTKAVQKTIICDDARIKSFDGSNFVYLADSCTICFFDVSGTNTSMRCFSSIVSEFDITLFEVSKKFGLIVYATVNNCVVICSLPSGKVINSVSLDHAATRIIITECWGFVVVYSEIYGEIEASNNGGGYGEIVVLNVNGSLIKKQEFPYKIDYWKEARSVQGFDYILFQYKNDTLSAFEVMYPEKQCLLCDAKDLIEAHYVMNAEVILIITKHGKILVHPISLSALFGDL